MKPRTLLLALLLACAASRASAKELRVLFVGNSFVYVNDLPGTFAKIAAAQGDHAVVESYAPGGANFEGHLRDPRVRRAIESKTWDFVVLQEQSQRPSFDEPQVAQEVIAPGLELDKLVRASHEGTRTAFYETWGRKDGDASNCKNTPNVCTYAGMQLRITQTYAELARKTGAALAPVGRAWAMVRRAHPDLELYGGDGIHPSERGTYLAACVFYATLFGKSPAGAPKLGLSADDADRLQQAAVVAALEPAVSK
jgi:hypothetical protein